MSRVYHSACLERGQSYWDYENFRLSSLQWEDVDRYEVNGRLGFGRFSEVMEGIVVDSGRKVVLKVLKPARTYKIKREIRVLQASHALRLFFRLMVFEHERPFSISCSFFYYSCCPQVSRILLNLRLTDKANRLAR